MILELRVKSKFVFCQLRYYNLLTEKKGKFTFFKYLFFLLKRTVTVNLKKVS